MPRLIDVGVLAVVVGTGTKTVGELCQANTKWTIMLLYLVRIGFTGLENVAFLVQNPSKIITTNGREIKAALKPKIIAWDVSGNIFNTFVNGA